MNDGYKLISDEEPTDEQLEQIMKAACQDAIAKAKAAKIEWDAYLLAETEKAKLFVKQLFGNIEPNSKTL
jgi:hypothetical protein